MEYHECRVSCVWGIMYVGYHLCGVSCVEYHVCEVSCVWSIMCVGYRVCGVSCVWSIMCAGGIMCVGPCVKSASGFESMPREYAQVRQTRFDEKHYFLKGASGF